MIIFSEKDHCYTHIESGKKLNGWTSLIKKYTKPFDESSQLICSAYKLLLGDEEYNRIVKNKFGRLYDLKAKEVSEFLESYLNKDVSSLITELKYEWEYAAILGSKFHKKLEDRAYEDGFFINPFTEEKFFTVKLEKEYDNQSASENLFELEDGYYPELLVWDNTMDQSNTPVTQIDGCFIETLDGVRYVDLIDFKTNSKRPIDYKGNFMLEPFNQIYDNSVNKYKLQVQFGAKLLETFGFKPRYMAFKHFIDYNEEKGRLFPTIYKGDLMNLFQERWINDVASE